MLNNKFKFKDKGFAINGMQKYEMVKFERCLVQHGNNPNPCGRDYCVSIAKPNNSKYVQSHNDRELRFLPKPNANGYADASFCLRPGFQEDRIDGLALESVAYPGRFVTLDDDKRKRILADRADINDHDDATLKMNPPGNNNMCRINSHCGSPDAFACHQKMCYPRKNVGALCTSSEQCKSGKCVLGLAGNFLSGSWVKMCGYDPQESS